MNSLRTRNLKITFHACASVLAALLLVNPEAAPAQATASEQTQPDVYPMAEGLFESDWESLAQQADA